MKYFDLLLIVILYYILVPNILALEKNIDSTPIENNIPSISKQDTLKFEEINNNILQSRSNIKELEGNIYKIKEYTEENKEDIANLKSLIEENSIRLYEVLIKIENDLYSSKNDQDKINNKIKSLISDNAKYNDQLKEIKKLQLSNFKEPKNIDRIWLLPKILLIFLIPFIFFLAYDKELNSKKSNAFNMSIFIIWGSTLIAYSLYNFYIKDILFIWLSNTDVVPFDVDIFLYQLIFISMTTLLIFKILGQKFTLISHIIITFFIAALLYPLLSYWLNIGQIYYLDSLKLSKITDLTNIILVHMLPAWIALIFLFINRKKFLKHSDLKNTAIPYSIMNTLIFLFIWIVLYNFTLEKDSHFLYSILNMGLATISGALVSLFMNKTLFKNYTLSIITGIFSGLVAISASGYLVSPIEAIIIGSIASIIQIIAYQLLKLIYLPHIKQNNIAILISIHGFTSIWGILSVPIFINQDLLLTQFIGILSIIILSFILALFYLFIDKIFSKSSAITR